MPALLKGQGVHQTPGVLRHRLCLCRSVADGRRCGRIEDEGDCQERLYDDTRTTGGRLTAKAEDFLKDYISDAYICTTAGKYGGTYFETGKAYRAIDTWCSMSDEDRQNFVFNYDALDLLVDPTYDGRLESNYGFKPQYDGYAPGTTQAAIDDGTATAQHTGSTTLKPNLYSQPSPSTIRQSVRYQDGNVYTDTDGVNAYPSGQLQTEWLAHP